MNNLTSIGKKSPAWTREFDSLIRAIGECKSKAEEDSIMTQEVETLKPRLKDPRLDKRFLKELLIRLIYIEMLGHDASWGHVKALQACSETNLIIKKARRVILLTSQLLTGLVYLPRLAASGMPQQLGPHWLHPRSESEHQCPTSFTSLVV